MVNDRVNDRVNVAVNHRTQSDEMFNYVETALILPPEI